MSSKIYVGNLPYTIDDASLRQNFSEFGGVLSAKVMMDRDTGRSKGFAFVEMSSAEEAQAAAFTLLNPHVYLDTVLLVGSIGAQQPSSMQGWFAAGASSASLLWFSALGFGARWLAPWFARPRAWQVLDALIGVTMWVLSALLLHHVLSSL